MLASDRFIALCEKLTNLKPRAEEIYNVTDLASLPVGFKFENKLAKVIYQ